MFIDLFHTAQLINYVVLTYYLMTTTKLLIWYVIKIEVCEVANCKLLFFST